MLDTDDLNSWKEAAANIMEELKALGVSKAQEKHCNMMDMVNMIQYGIFRSGYNGWAIDCANEWIWNRNIDYDTKCAAKKDKKARVLNIG